MYLLLTYPTKGPQTMTTQLQTRHNEELAPQAGLDVSVLAGQVTESTANMYRRDVDAYTTWAASQNLQPLTSSTFARWRVYLVNTTTYSPRTINRMLSAVRKVVSQGAAQGHIDQQTADRFRATEGVRVAAMKDRQKDNARVAIPPATMRLLVEQPNQDTLTGIRDRAFLLALATSGVRVAELVNLTVAQIEQKEEGYGLNVMGKNREEAHFAPLTMEAYNAIQKWLDARSVSSDFVFISNKGRGDRFTEKPMSSVAAWKLVRKYANQLGLDNVKPHDFRRFVGTQLAQVKGVDTAQKVLGHKNASTTLNHYVLTEAKANVTEGLF